MGYKACCLARDGRNVGEPCRMIFYSYNPLHNGTKGVALPHLAEINKINQETIAEAIGPNWLSRSLHRGHSWVLLHTNVTRLKV